MPTDGAFFRRTALATTSVVAESFDVETQSKIQRMRARDGLSFIQIRRWWLHLRGTRPRTWVFVGVSVICLLFYQRESITTNESTCNFRQRPLMVQLLGRANITQLTLKDTPELFIEDRRNHYWIDGGVEWHYPRSERKQGCVALGKWQDEHHPSCLVVHEIDLLQKQFRLLGSGYYRSGFMFQEYDGTKRALKMKRYKSKLDFNERLWDKHRRDALALEQMSNSPYVMNIYGYCMNSVIVDYSDKRSLYHIFDSELSKEELLKVAHDVACAVRDAHNFDERERATIVHADISPDQFLLVDGIYKLNDFNRGKFLSWDPERDEQCGISYELNGGNVSANMVQPTFFEIYASKRGCALPREVLTLLNCF